MPTQDVLSIVAPGVETKSGIFPKTTKVISHFVIYVSECVCVGHDHEGLERVSGEAI